MINHLTELVTSFFLVRLFDIYESYMRIGGVDAKVFIMHGTDDNVVPVEQYVAQKIIVTIFLVARNFTKSAKIHIQSCSLTRLDTIIIEKNWDMLNISRFVILG